MSYPEKYRQRTIEYRQEGHTLEETKEIFKVSISTIRAWEKRSKEKGDLKPKIPERPFKKIDPEKLKIYVEEHPDAYQNEIAKAFKCSPEAVRKALKRLKITRKKDKQIERTKTGKSRRIHRKNSFYSFRKYCLCR